MTSRVLATCGVNNGGCDKRCNDTLHGPVCSCPEGYLLAPDRRTCLGKTSRPVLVRPSDLCWRDSQTCLINRRILFCLPHPSKQDNVTCVVCDVTDITCVCLLLWHVDIDECSSANQRCSHECMNTIGSFQCICPRGFKVDSDKVTCVDVNECDVSTTCEHSCYNTPGSHTCGCKTGFRGTGWKGQCYEMGLCACWGDPHCLSFDSKWNHFQGRVYV